jgi:IS5 family transposase
MASGLFDEQFRLQELTKMGDPLERLDKYIDFEMFRDLLESGYEQYDVTKGGRPSFDKVMMFKGLVLKSMYNLSFEKLEYHIKDRLSFQRFLGISLGDRVPDANTFWDFNEIVSKKGIIDEVFIQLRHQLTDQGLIMNNGSLVDASIVDAPVQRNTREENEKIKQGEKPAGWSGNKTSQKDLDADWTKKHGQHRYGYKNHIKVDKGSKLITNFEVSSASVHDSQMLGYLLEEEDAHHELYADSAYRSEQIEKELKGRKIRSRIHKKGYRGNPLNARDKAINTNKSRVRARVEHVFGDMCQTMGKIIVRQIGMVRNTAAITMMNICYNMRRSSYLLASSEP